MYGTDNIILVGMPGCGKSTVGVVLAKLLCMDFVDVDLVIQHRENSPLQKLLDERGISEFLELEADAVESLDCSRSVIAPGGSAVLTERGAARLRELGCVVYIRLPCEEIERRLNNLSERGVAMSGNQTIQDVYDYRAPYYESCADITVEPVGLTIEQTCREIVRRLAKSGV